MTHCSIHQCYSHGTFFGPGLSFCLSWCYLLFVLCVPEYVPLVFFSLSPLSSFFSSLLFSRTQPLNVQGLNSPQKRTKVFRFFRSRKIDIACLQETHFSPSSTPRYFDARYSQVYHAVAPEKKRGVMVAFHNCVPFKCVQSIADPQGRYLLLTGTLMDTEVTLCTYYAPNTRQIPFLSHLHEVIFSHLKGTLLLCGDSNLVFQPRIDCSARDESRSDHNSKTYCGLLTKLGLVDAWRGFHPLPRDYTYFSHPHASFSRIDHVLVQKQFLPQVASASILTVPWSDHDPILVECKSLVLRPPRTSWCLNDSLLSRPEVVQELTTRSSEYFFAKYGLGGLFGYVVGSIQGSYERPPNPTSF